MNKETQGYMNAGMAMAKEIDVIEKRMRDGLREWHWKHEMLAKMAAHDGEEEEMQRLMEVECVLGCSSLADSETSARGSQLRAVVQEAVRGNAAKAARMFHAAMRKALQEVKEREAALEEVKQTPLATKWVSLWNRGVKKRGVKKPAAKKLAAK